MQQMAVDGHVRGLGGRRHEAGGLLHDAYVVKVDICVAITPVAGALEIYYDRLARVGGGVEVNDP